MFNPLNLILLAFIVFVFFKLRSVLGYRNPEDEEAQEKMARRHRNIYDTPEDVEEEAEEERDGEADESAEEAGVVIDQPAEPAPDMAADIKGGRGIALFKAARRDFNEAQFLQGATRAYEMILLAFAKGDLSPVRDFLSEPVYESFATAIKEREAAGKKMITRILKLGRPRLEDALIIEGGQDTQVQLEVRFRAELITDLCDKDLSDDEAFARTALQTSDDLWVFEQALAEKQNRWRLVRTE